MIKTSAVDLHPTVDLPAIIEKPGAQIGRYKLLQQIGEGGMGVVYMAEQKHPVKRRVALKIIKPGMDTREVIARFEAERQALAMMEHPNIAKVLDAGSTETGRPYFVMELVKGVPMLQYCDKNQLDTKARLRLFMDVCHAIRHAHVKGIIHRDIKPSNVLVTLHDSEPVPKVIDFGVAKATNTELTQKTLFTEYGQMVGTPAYMSPEQAEMSGLDIDTRSDIYSLGVLLYELLTGTTPFDKEELQSKGYADMMRIIREKEPPRPSTRVSTLETAISQVGDHRKADLQKLGSYLRGEVDWIVMKCLEKNRERRYATAAELADELRRHLSGEVVQARPPSTLYRAQKFARRHRAVLATIALVLVISVLASVVASIGWVRAGAAAGRARAAAAELGEQRKFAEDQRRRATEEAEYAHMFSDRILATLSPSGHDDMAAASTTLPVPVKRSVDPGELLAELIELELSAPHRDTERVVDLQLRLSNWRRYVERDGAGAIVAAHDALAGALSLGSEDIRLRARTALAALLLNSHDQPAEVNDLLAEILTTLRAEGKSSTDQLQEWLMRAAHHAMRSGDKRESFGLYRELLELLDAGAVPRRVKSRAALRVRTVLAAMAADRGDTELTNEFAKPARFLIDLAAQDGGRVAADPSVTLLRATLAYAETQDGDASPAKEQLMQAYRDLETMRSIDPSAMKMVLEWLCEVAERDGVTAEADQWRSALRNLDELRYPHAIARPKNLDFEEPAGRAGLPTGWEGLRVSPRTGGVGAEVSLDTDTARSGSASARLHRSSESESASATTTLTQAISATAYRGKMARISGWIRTSKASTGAGLWLRVDGAGGVSTKFDNMAHRLVEGDSEWTQCEVVLDVSENAKMVAFGAILFGEGTAWIDDLNLNIMEVPSFAGTWDTTYGRMNLDQDGVEVRGDYSIGDTTNTLSGEVVDKRLAFSYFEPGIDGEGWFELAEDGQTFSGKWRQRWKPSWNQWRGVRASERAETGSPVNMAFDQGPKDQVPIGWFVPSSLRAAGYTAVLTNQTPAQGPLCARISPPDATGPIFNNLMQTVDAKPYRGHRVRLSASVRVAGQALVDRAQVWLRVDRANNRGTGLFDNMGDRPIRSPEWKRYEIVGTVDEDAEDINIGIIVFGGATAWLDDVRIDILDETTE